MSGIKINPEVLVWARRRWGLEPAEAAAELGLSEADLAKVESGEAKPAFELIDQMGKAYRIAVGALLSLQPPPPLNLPGAFRTVRGAPPRLNGDAIRAVTEAQEDREEATYLADDLGASIAPRLPEATLEHDPETLGASFRERLGVNDDEQLGWPDAEAAFCAWRQKIEERNILVFLRGAPPAAYRGFALQGEGQMAAIVINARETPQARSFTLMHAVGHLLLRSSSVCSEDTRLDDRPAEPFCNRFAAAVLMPQSLMRSCTFVLEAGSAVSVDERTIRLIAGRLQVSRPAAANRLLALGAALEPDRVEQFLKTDQQSDIWLEPNDRWGDFYRHHADRLGWRYTKLVVEAMADDWLDDTDAWLSLDMNPDHLPQIAALLGIRVPAAARPR